MSVPTDPPPPVAAIDDDADVEEEEDKEAAVELLCPGDSVLLAIPSSME
jgi:hypothetical protein